MRLGSQSSVQVVERMVELRGLLFAFAVLNIVLVLAALCVAARLLQLVHHLRRRLHQHESVQTIVGYLPPPN